MFIDFKLAAHDPIADNILTRAIRAVEIRSFKRKTTTNDGEQNHAKTPYIQGRSCV